MIVRALISQGVPTNIEKTVHSEQDLSAWYPRIQGVRFNHVVSATSHQLNSSYLSNEIDRLVLRTIRSNADLIITTGKTVIAENLGASRYAPLLILTRQERIFARATSQPSAQPVFITSSFGAYENPSVSPIGQTSGDLATWVSNFLSGFESIVLESGLSVALELQEILDEICLTVTGASDLNQAKELAELFLKQFKGGKSMVHLLEVDGTYFFRCGLSPES